MINVINGVVILMLLLAVTTVVLVVGLPVLLKDGLDAWISLFDKIKECKNGKRY